MANVIIIAVIAVVFIAVVVNYVKKGGHSDCCGTDGPVAKKGPADKNVANYSYTYKVKVNGMSCENCAKTVTNAFNSQPDTMAEVDLAEGMATVHTKTPADSETLTRIVRNAGYGIGPITEA